MQVGAVELGVAQIAIAQAAALGSPGVWSLSTTRSESVTTRLRLKMPNSEPSEPNVKNGTA